MEFRQINQSFAAVGLQTMGGAYTTGEVNLTAGNRPLRVRSISVDPPAQDAWRSAGTGTLLQRGRNRSCRGLAPPLAILSASCGKRSLEDNHSLDKLVNVGRPHEILGIMPSGIDVMDNRTNLVAPRAPCFRQNRGFHILHVIGRLKDGVTAQARRQS